MYSKKILTHLAQDSKLATVISAVPAKERREITVGTVDPLEHMVRAVMSQQLHIKVAATIFRRFCDLFDAEFPKAEEILAKDITTYRSIGLSNQKAQYICNIADFFIAEKTFVSNLHHHSDDEIISKLTEIKGVGVWTVEMLLIFNLGRPDIFPVKDLGVQQAMIKAYNLRSEGKALLTRMETIAKAWRPYRSTASLLLWQWKNMNN